MLSLRTLGAAGLHSADGGDVDAVLRRTKSFALLAYLAAPAPGTWHRRDALLAMFWPDADASRARTALRTALHALRRDLPTGAIRTRGDDDVQLDPALVTSDAGDLASASLQGDLARVLELYRGDYLPSFHAGVGVEFDEWIESERQRLRGLAIDAAARLTAVREAEGDIAGAIAAARRAASLSPDDEPAARRLAILLDRAGDRAQGLHVLDALARRIDSEYGAPVSAETRSLMQQLRAAPAPASRFVPAPAPAPRPAPRVAPVRRRSRRLAYAIAGATVLTVGTLTLARVRDMRAAGDPDRLLAIVPMDNDTRDTALAYVATGIADGIGRRLEGIGGLQVRAIARSALPSAIRDDVPGLARRLRASLVLRSHLARVGDSLEVRAELHDAHAAEPVYITTERFTLHGLDEASRAIAASIAGALFRAPTPYVPRPAQSPVDPESFRLTVEGWHELLSTGNQARALELFDAATRRDPANARAWAGVSSVLAAQTATARIPLASGYDGVVAAAGRALALDSLQASALANLGIVRALRFQRVSAGVPLLEAAQAAEPANAEVFLVFAALYQRAHEWDRAIDLVRIARRLDPFNTFYLEAEATYELCAERPEAALRLLREDVSALPRGAGVKFGMTRVLARLGRYDEALDTWRASDAGQADSVIAAALARARGERGYWAVRHLEGAARVRALEAQQAAGHQVSPLVMMQALFAAGDTARGFAMLEPAARERYHPLYKLPCMPDFDEVRATPRFVQLQRQVGALPK